MAYRLGRVQLILRTEGGWYGVRQDTGQTVRLLGASIICPLPRTQPNHYRTPAYGPQFQPNEENPQWKPDRPTP